MAIAAFAKTLSQSRQTTMAGRYVRKFKGELGTKYRVFLPQFTYEDEHGVTREDIGTITVAGRTFNGKKLGVYSYVFDEGEITIADDDSFKDNTALTNLERISLVIREAAYNAALTAAHEQAEKVARDCETTVDQKALAMQEEQLKIEFFGDKDHDPKEENKLLVGRPDKMTYTIGLFVPLSPEGAPVFEKAVTGIWNLSSGRQKKIQACYESDAYKAQFKAGKIGKPYLEISYNYVGTTAKEAGKDATYEFITDELSLEKMYPTEWAQYAKKFLDTIPQGNPDKMAETIVAKCGDLHNRSTIAEITSKFYSHVATMKTALAAIKHLDQDYLKKYKNAILQIPAINEMGNLKTFVESIQTDEAEEATSVAEASQTTATAPVAETVAPTTKIESAGVSATFGGLGSGGTTIDDDDALGEI